VLPSGLFVGRRPDDFGPEFFVKEGDAPLTPGFELFLEAAPLVTAAADDDDTDAILDVLVVVAVVDFIFVVVCPALVLSAPALALLLVVTDPGASDESAVFIRFPTFDPRLRERDVLFFVPPSFSLVFLSACSASSVMVLNAAISRSSERSVAAAVVRVVVVVVVVSLLLVLVLELVAIVLSPWCSPSIIVFSPMRFPADKLHA